MKNIYPMIKVEATNRVLTNRDKHSLPNPTGY